MGYYATGDGTISFGRAISKTEREYIEESLFNWEQISWSHDLDGDHMYILHDSNYHYDQWENNLKELEQKFPIKDGSKIEFCGEDGQHWRFIFRNGTWLEQNGRIVYE